MKIGTQDTKAKRLFHLTIFTLLSVFSTVSNCSAGIFTCGTRTNQAGQIIPGFGCGEVVINLQTGSLDFINWTQFEVRVPSPTGSAGDPHPYCSAWIPGASLSTPLASPIVPDAPVGPNVVIVNYNGWCGNAAAVIANTFFPNVPAQVVKPLAWYGCILSNGRIIGIPDTVTPYVLGLAQPCN